MQRNIVKKSERENPYGEKKATAEAVKKESSKSKAESKAEKSDVSAQISVTEDANSAQENTPTQQNWTATVDLPQQYSALNVREEPNGKIVGTLKNGIQVTLHQLLEPIDGETWVQIGNKQFVNMAFLKTE